MSLFLTVLEAGSQDQDPWRLVSASLLVNWPPFSPGSLTQSKGQGDTLTTLIRSLISSPRVLFPGPKHPPEVPIS